MLGSETARARWLLLAPTALLYAVTFFVPLALLLVFSVATWDRGVIRLGFSLVNYRDFFADGVTLGIFGRTVRLAIFITGVPVNLPRVHRLDVHALRKFPAATFDDRASINGHPGCSPIATRG